MLKRIIAFALIIIVPGQNFAQDSKAYTQSINGTKLSFEVQALRKPYLSITFGMEKGSQPGVAITQYNAIQYSKWLSICTSTLYRSPTAAKWEYADKAGTTTAYSFGNDTAHLKDCARHRDHNGNNMHPLNHKRPNAQPNI